MTAIARRDLLKLGMGAASALLLSAGCCPPLVQRGRAWANAQKTRGIEPAYRGHPKSLEDLVELVGRAEAERVGIRSTGSGHSFSDVALSRGYLLSPRCLDAVLELDQSQLKPAMARVPLLRVESGIVLHELNRELEKRGLALTNMGSYDAQTIVGAATTGTHGSGLGFGPIASQIRSIEIVTKGAEVLKVEPNNGITDPRKFPGYIATAHGQVAARLVQDDDRFNAIAVSMGCMGVIYSVVLEPVPRFWLREVRTPTTWSALTKSDGLLDRLLRKKRLKPQGQSEPEHYEIYVNPYRRNGDHRCLLTERYRIPPNRFRTAEAMERGQLGTNALAALSVLIGRGKAVRDYIDAHPSQMPKLLDLSLEGLVDREYVDESHQVFQLGEANYLRAYGIEMAFDLAQTVAATERLFAIAEGLSTRGIVHTAPVGLRFVAAAEAHLAMQHGRRTMMMEIPMLVGARGADYLLTHYEVAYLREFRARPHWGLDLDVIRNAETVRWLYPASYPKWEQLYRELNARGTFNGPFTDRLGISLGHAETRAQ
jgi:L-gulono-1,4-lactone dehydrogenase